MYALVLAHLKTRETRQDPDARRCWKVRLVKGLHERGLTAGEIRQLMRFIDWMMDLPPALEEEFRQEIHRYEEEKRMPYITSFERFGIRKGLLEGIEALLEFKFGAEGLKVLPEIQQIHDHEKLSAILQAIKTAPTLDELRRVWSSD